jgi:hypothetical protein
VEEAAHPGARCDVEQRPRPFDVHPLELLGRRVVAVEGRDVDDGVAPGDRPLEPGAVEQVDALVADVGAALAELTKPVAPVT